MVVWSSRCGYHSGMFVVITKCNTKLSEVMHVLTTAGDEVIITDLYIVIICCLQVGGSVLRYIQPNPPNPGQRFQHNNPQQVNKISTLNAHTGLVS